MVRGGQREGAGRKSTWVSGAKFEDTTVIRVPKSIKDQVVNIAYKLDAGEHIDLDSNSKIKELESKLSLLQLDNELLLKDLQSKLLDLETKSKRIEELEQENNQLRNLDQSEKQLVTNSKEESNDLVTQSENHTQLGLLDLVTKDKPALDFAFIDYLKKNPLQGNLLALRLNGVNPSTLSNKKSDLFFITPDKFYDWLQSKDVDGIRWSIIGEGKKARYIPVDDTPIHKLQALKEWLQVNT